MLISDVNKHRNRSGRNDSLTSTANEEVSRNNQTSKGHKLSSSIKYTGSTTQTMPLPVAKITSATKKVTINLYEDNYKIPSSCNKAGATAGVAKKITY